jgi:ABC-type amino acid transport substrate-binding protein
MRSRQNNSLGWLGIAIATIAIALSLFVLVRSRKDTTTIDNTPPILGLLERVDRTGELHAGYGVYPPYTIEDPSTKQVSGYSVDVIEQIASELKCTVVWHRLNWNTMNADLQRGDFDVIADPIFITIPRAREFSFTEPYAYFAEGIAVVRVNDSRFSKFDDLDQANVRIAVGQGWASETFVKNRFTKANITAVQTSNDLLQVFNEVVAGRTDVAVTDGADAQRFVKEHPTSVKALFLDNPPAFMPAAFALRTSDTKGTKFISDSLKNLRTTGILDAFAKKYQLPNSEVDVRSK